MPSSNDHYSSQAHVAILGASGFGGGELLRLLINHPKLADATGLVSLQMIAHSNAGKPVAALHPHLAGLISGSFTAVLFAALPHGELAKLWPQLAATLAPHVRVIDLSADFRLKDEAAFAQAYGYAHPCPAALADFRYAVSELSADLLGATRIANPGCFATALNLALAPLASVIPSASIFVSAVTGSSGSGNKLSDGTHHPTRAHDFRAYKVLQHQHSAEINQCLAEQHWPHQLQWVAHSAPMVRGIFATVQFQCDIDQQTLRTHFQKFYAGKPFVRVLDTDSARLAAVLGSNFCDLSIVVHEGQAALTVALDNLVKGMAGQAVQNMNLSFGWAEDAGLRLAGIYP
jgi:LysW-gamma-L-alpha-aminoadipyl-6-phosphate/LysW-L-glutamyl-5-phosphate reductase